MMSVVFVEEGNAMPLLRCVSQGGGNASCLCEHYDRSDTDDDSFAAAKTRMQQLIMGLDQRLPNTTVWGLTSHYLLSLRATPKYNDGPWFVWIDPFYLSSFRIAYRLPDGELPIPDSEISFCVKDVDLAVERTMLALRYSRGWPDSPDLY